MLLKDKEAIKESDISFFLGELSRASLHRIAKTIGLKCSPKLSKKAVTDRLSFVYNGVPLLVAKVLSKEAVEVLKAMAESGFEAPPTDDAGLIELQRLALALPIDSETQKPALFVAPKKTAQEILDIVNR